MLMDSRPWYGGEISILAQLWQMRLGLPWPVQPSRQFRRGVLAPAAPCRRVLVDLIAVNLMDLADDQHGGYRLDPPLPTARMCTRPKYPKLGIGERRIG